MITKERLEELIEQEATIWKVPYGTPIETKLHKLSFVGNKLNLKEDYLMEYSLKNYDYIMSGILSQLFETKEDAEEYSEFGNITRTERLELPSWEEINQKDDYCFEFFSKNNIRCWLAVNMPYKNDIGIISVAHSMNETSVENIFVERFTRENYNEARRLCVKLFKGEEI